MDFYQIFLPVAMVIYVLLVFVLRSVIHWFKTGRNPFVFERTDRAHDYIGKIYKLMTALTLISIVLFSFMPAWYQYLVPIKYMEIEALQRSGVILLIVSFLFTSVAQYNMSLSWRIGIDYSERTDLINNGLFRFSRNPVFLGVILSYAGVFLIAPNALTFSVFFTIWFVIQIQVRLEEEYLANQHGEIYVEYKSNVRRWL